MSPLELDSVKEGVPSVWVGVDPSTLCGGVHVSVRMLGPRPGVLELHQIEHCGATKQQYGAQNTPSTGAFSAPLPPIQRKRS